MSMNLRHEDVLKLHAVKAILDTDYRYHYTIDELAQKVGTNPFKLKVGFKLLFNSTLFEYLTTVRIERAKHLLESTEHPVKRIAAEVGYIRPANFIRRFKRVTGVLPGDWRRGKVITPEADNDAA